MEVFSLEKSRKHWIGLNYTDLRQKAEILLRKLEITFFFWKQGFALSPGLQ